MWLKEANAETWQLRLDKRLTLNELGWKDAFWRVRVDDLTGHFRYVQTKLDQRLDNSLPLGNIAGSVASSAFALHS